MLVENHQFHCDMKRNFYVRRWVIQMVIDMHVHCSEGSVDAKASIFDIVEKLKSRGFDGMVITDHDSYKGYEAWVKSGRTDFKVFKGIEYDTADGGHIIVIMPEGADTKIFELRGLKVRTLVDLVHKMGGVLGPAHPFEYKRLGIANNPRWFNKLGIFYEFDFIEGFNSCCGEMGNILAHSFAKKFGVPSTAGSDSHRLDCVGKARTILDDKEIPIESTDELIQAIRDKRITEATGEYHQSNLVRHRTMFETGLYGFYIFNKIESLRVRWRREAELLKLHNLGYNLKEVVNN